MKVYKHMTFFIWNECFADRNKTAHWYYFKMVYGFNVFDMFYRWSDILFAVTNYNNYYFYL